MYRLYLFIIGILVPCLVLAADAQMNARSLQFLRQGQEQIKKGNLQGAVRLYQQAVKAAPNNPEANFYYGDGLIRIGKRKQGVKQVQKAIALAPKRLDLRMAAATLYRLAGDYRHAIEEYRQILRLQPRGQLADQATKAMTLVMATRHRNNGDYESAIFLLSDLLDQYPKDLEIMVQIATSYQAAKNYKQAEKVFRLMKKLYPKDLTVRMHFARMYQETKQMKKAQKEYLEVVQLDPKGLTGKQAAMSIGMYDAEKLKKQGNYVAALKIYKEVLNMLPNDKFALFNIATTAQFLGKNREARQAYERYLKIVPDDTQALYNLSRLFVDMGAVEPAVQLLERIIKIAPKSETAGLAQKNLERLLEVRSNTAIKNQEFAKGLQDIERVLKVDPENIEKRIEHGRMLNNTFQFARAKKELEGVLQKDPKNLQAMFQLAMANENLGLTSEAEVLYVKINRIDQLSKLAKFSTNRLVTLSAKRLFNEGKLPQARKEFEDILKTDKKNFEAHNYLALIHQRNNDLLSAAKEYEKAIEIKPNNVSARFNLATIYESLNNEEKALTEYRRVVSKSRNNEISAVAKRRLNIVESRLNGFTFGLNYGMTSDTNSNLGSDTPRPLGGGSGALVLSSPFPELRSDFDINTAYRRKIGSSTRAGLLLNANYQIFHNQGADILRSTVSPFLMFGGYKKNISLSMAYDRTKTLSADGREDLIVAGDHNLTTSFRLDGSYRFSRKPFMKWLTRSKSNDRVSSQLSGYFAAVDFEANIQSLAYDLYGTQIYALGATLNQSLRPGYSSSFGYSYQNSVPASFAGRDLANTAHTFSVKWERLMFFGILGSLDYQVTARFYKYSDSGLFVDTQVRKKRYSLYNALTAKLSYQYHPSLIIDFGLTGQLNSANLDARCSIQIDPDPNVEPENVCFSGDGVNTGLLQPVGAVPNGNLGDFSRYNIFLRANLSFR